MNTEPILTTLDVGIGEMFLYEGCIWTRTDTYTAKCPQSGSCHFGHFGDEGTQSEWKNVLDTAVKLNQDRIQTVLLEMDTLAFLEGEDYSA